MVRSAAWSSIAQTIVKATTLEVCAIQFHRANSTLLFKFDEEKQECIFGGSRTGGGVPVWFWPVLPEGHTQEVITYTAYEFWKRGISKI